MPRLENSPEVKALFFPATLPIDLCSACYWRVYDDLPTIEHPPYTETHSRCVDCQAQLGTEDV